MSHEHLTPEELTAYLEGQVNGEERRRVELHLIACTPCLDEVLGLLRIVKPEEGRGLPPPPPG